MIEFSKMCAGGNDFIVIDNRKKVIPPDIAVFTRQVCRRKFSIGADGLLLLENSSPGNDFRMRIFNPDGSEPGMCGNGARCIARFAQRIGVTGERMNFETLAGRIEAEVHDDNVRLKMSDPTDIKLHLRLRLDADVYEVHYLNSGVPHVILFTESPDSLSVNELGRKIRYHREFAPEGANVDFVRVEGKSSLRLRTYERGVEEETLACGTGAVASAIAAFSLGKVSKSPVKVHTRGGEILKIYFEGSPPKVTNVYLEGKARFVYEGEIEDIKRGLKR